VRCLACKQITVCHGELENQSGFDDQDAAIYRPNSDWKAFHSADRKPQKGKAPLIAWSASIGGSIVVAGVVLLILFPEKQKPPIASPEMKLMPVANAKKLKPQVIEKDLPSRVEKGFPTKPKPEPEPERPEPMPERSSPMVVQLDKETDRAEKKAKARKLIYQSGYEPRSYKESLREAMMIFESLVPTFGDSRDQQLEKARTLLYIFYLDLRITGGPRSKEASECQRILSKQRFLPNEISPFHESVRQDINSLYMSGRTEHLRDTVFRKKKP
jgi:hypothetical protein